MVLKRFSFTPFQIGLHAFSLLPFSIFVFNFLTDAGFSGNIQRLEFRTGRLALIWLILSLFCSPVYWLTGYREAFKARKTLGRYAFFYAFLHGMVFLVLDYAFDIHLILITLGDTLYLLLGIIAFIILLLLAVTSNPQSQAILKKNWGRLHKLVYLAAILGVIHYFLIEKSDTRWPLTAAIILSGLLVVRFPAIHKRITLRKQANKVVIKTRSGKAS
ncbi:MAG: ferric reductase-like transmembrane domain-containing protein [Chloroflexi bacterium]|nr:ferric reductase-like transmembrane domain-containing protein [Chloroflexota bacterium]